MQIVPQTTPRIPNWFMTPPINITKSFVRLREVTSDVVSLDGGRKNLDYRGILKVNCLNFAFENRGITMDAATHTRQPPNMQEFFVILSSGLRGDDRFGVGKDTYGLSQRLERYLHLFPARTHLSLDNRYVDFNIRELNETLKPVGLFLITEFL